MTKENICSYHGDIIRMSQKLLKSRSTKCDDKWSDEARQGLQEIIELAKMAKVAGVHMENRLKVYREGIESMGFMRKKRKKYERK